MKLWTNGFFHTLNSESEIINHILTKDGIIVSLGEDALKYPCDEIIDLRGSHVYPGFIDTHLHLIGLGQKLNSLYVENIKDKYSLMDFIRNNLSNNPLIIEGYHNIGLTKIHLDSISSTTPIILKHNDYHSFTVNSFVLKSLNLKHETGILLEDEGTLVQTLINKEPLLLKKYTLDATNHLYKHGITAILTDDLGYFNTYQETKEILVSVLKEQKLKTHLLIHEKILDDFILDENKFNNTNLVVTAVKTFYDGTLSSQTALLYKNYLNKNHFGKRMNDTIYYEKLIKKARTTNLDIAVHVIGDRALDEWLDLLIKYPNKKGLDRIIHASLSNNKIINKMRALPITLDLQPLFISSDLPYINSIITEAPLIYPFKSYLENNIAFSFSSDAPVETVSVIEGIKSSIYRKSKFDNLTYHAYQSIDLYTAIKKYTIDAAVSLGYKNKGLLKNGFIADFTILDKALDLNNLDNINILATVIDETFVYKK